jgi:hypothetical protein
MSDNAATALKTQTKIVENCSVCYFSRNHYSEMEDNKQRITLECRYNTPVMFKCFDGSVETHWPVVDEVDWCGLYQKSKLLEK